MLLVFLVGVGADELIALALDGGAEGVFHRGLGGPADLVGGEAEVAVGDEEDLLLAGAGGLVSFRQGVDGHA